MAHASRSSVTAMRARRDASAAAVYRLFQPQSESVQVEGRLVKLDNRQAEFLLFNLMMAMFYIRLGQKIIDIGGAFQAGDFAAVLEHFPDSLVPERRKRRAYLSGILSKNEVRRQGPYNRKLFFRLRQGYYILNPTLRLRVDGEWRALHELLDPERIGYPYLEAAALDYDVNAAIERGLDAFRRQLRVIAEQLAATPPHPPAEPAAAGDAAS
ncbi:MAG: hypothetical protein B7Z66_11575 [Chromatiales bacterium 21-64-14]|nr:MAG: hypothetical protein B7Z66_11575 [Chromatiales bacterium 21-64-14]